MSASRISRKASSFTESVIREMTREASRYQAINLAQGFPDFPAPLFIKEAATAAILADLNQYSVTWGAPSLRNAVAEKYRRFYNWKVDPERELTVCCGATESMISAVLALVDPGDQVIVFEPFYENYGPDAIIAGARPIFVPFQGEEEWTLDPERLESAVRSAHAEGGVRALILNSPNNPTGHVFSLEELAQIARLAREYDFYVITDEIYEHILYDGHRHHPIALLPGMKERTVTISGLSKTFSITGWRIGYIIAPPDLTDAIRKMHDFLTVGAPAPLQEAAAEALKVGEEYYSSLASDYRERRNLMLHALWDAGLKPYAPAGAYYTMTDIRAVTDEIDLEFVRRLIREGGVAAVPGSSFFRNPADGRHLIRFAFCKSQQLLREAAERIKSFLKSSRTQ